MAVARFLLRPLGLAVDGDAGRDVRQAHRRVGLVDLLAARARGAHELHPDVLVVDLDLHGLVDVRIDEHAGERRVPARGRVVGADADQPVHAGLGAQVAVGPLAGDAHGRALDARLVARLQVQELAAEPAPRRPAHVHPLQHLGPILRFSAARARVDAHQRALPVVGTGQHAGELHLAHHGLGRVEHARGLRRGRLVLGFVGQVDQDPRFLRRLELGVETVDRRFELRLLAQQRLSFLGGGPEVRAAGLRVQFRYAISFAGDVKDAPGESPGGSPAC